MRASMSMPYQTHKDQQPNKYILCCSKAVKTENIAILEPCSHAVSHQFADDKFIREALQEKGREITLIQRHHAEDNLGVAAASLLAREAQKEAVEELSSKYSIPLPKGARWEAIIAGRAFVAKHGREALREICKFHFRTTELVLKSDLPSSELNEKDSRDSILKK